MLLTAPSTALRGALRSPLPSTALLCRTRPPHSSRSSSLGTALSSGSSVSRRPFSSSTRWQAAPALSADVDHYAVLGLRKTATRNEIKLRFYELSKKHHPDSPSTSSETPEQRTAFFQKLSQSYSVLSDPDQRKSYDLSRSGSAVPPHRRRPTHPGYTTASGGMGYSGAGSEAWTENDERRERANYAWQHPKRGQGAGETAAGAAQARVDPFASRRGRSSGASATDHFQAYARRAHVRAEQQAAAAAAASKGRGLGATHAEGHHYRAGTSVFGAEKAEEESRLINDSSTMRSGQVVLVFLAVFSLAIFFANDRGKKEHHNARR
ncbi:hypothetical protein JCM8097_006996 [Rhodosporidiobolus ruineniae]